MQQQAERGAAVREAAIFQAAELAEGTPSGWQAASGALTSFAAIVGGGASINSNGGLPLPGGGPAPAHCTPYGRFGCEPLR